MKEERYCVTCANWIPTEPATAGATDHIVIDHR